MDANWFQTLKLLDRFAVNIHPKLTSLRLDSVHVYLLKHSTFKAS